MAESPEQDRRKEGVPVPVDTWVPYLKSDSSDYLDAPGRTLDELTPKARAEVEKRHAEMRAKGFSYDYEARLSAIEARLAGKSSEVEEQAEAPEAPEEGAEV
jgi:hypothetical protein